MKSVLLISGLDPTGGAGLLADARVCALHGVRAVGVATALTEQSTQGVRAANPVAAEVVAGQLQALLTDVEVAAIKIGMLGSRAVAEAIAEALALTAAPAVWDPVLRPTTGSVALYDGDPREAVALLADHVTVLTPNADEASVLLGRPVRTADDALLLAELGLDAVLLKGGHLGDREAIDVLISGGERIELSGARVALETPVHGTGCALSTALACNLAIGQSLPAAARAAKDFVSERLAAAVTVGRGARCVV